MLTCPRQLQASSSKAVFVITTSNGSGTRAVVEWDSRKVLMARGPIMEILKAAGQKKTRGSVTLIGNEYDVGEFVIRVGKAINEHEGKLYGVYLGIACEGVSQTDVASSVILEYLKHLQRSLECKSIHLTVLPDVDSEFALGSMYTNKHEAVQIFQLSCTFLQTDDKKIRTGNDAASVPTSIT